MASIEERVEELVTPKIESLGYNVYDVQYAKEGKDYFLRIFIDKKDGIDLNDCEKVNNEINDILDEADYIKEQYFLEISSPGIERILRKDKHLEIAKGEQVEIKLFGKLEIENGKKEYIGTLKSFDNEAIYIEEIEKNKEIKILRKNISNMKLKYNW